MNKTFDIACLVLAGGQSSRFGSDKGLAELEGVPLIAHIVSRLRAQTSGKVLVSADTSSGYHGFGDGLVGDIWPMQAGPLAGLHAGLVWAREAGHTRLVTCAVDTPFLPPDYIQRLGAVEYAGIAMSFGRLHPVCGIWPVDFLNDLEAFLHSGRRAVRDWADYCHAQTVEFPQTDGIDPFLNINTPDDLHAAAQNIAEVG